LNSWLKKTKNKGKKGGAKQLTFDLDFDGGFGGRADAVVGGADVHPVVVPLHLTQLER
jgi:hypothetical protein